MENELSANNGQTIIICKNCGSNGVKVNVKKPSFIPLILGIGLIISFVKSISEQAYNRGTNFFYELFINQFIPVEKEELIHPFNDSQGISHFIKITPIDSVMNLLIFLIAIVLCIWGILNVKKRIEKKYMYNVTCQSCNNTFSVEQETFDEYVDSIR